MSFQSIRTTKEPDGNGCQALYIISFQFSYICLSLVTSMQLPRLRKIYVNFCLIHNQTHRILSNWNSKEKQIWLRKFVVVYTLRFAAVYLVWSCAASGMSRQYKANMGYLMPSRKAFLRGKAKRSATKSKKVQIIF